MIQKTNQEWEEIKFKNNLGPQIGGLIKQAVDLVIAETPSIADVSDKVKIDRLKFWVDTLYEISEAKKKELTANQPKKDEEIVL